MARVTRSRPRRGTGLRRRAHQQAAAEYRPQIRGVRRDTRGQVGSLRSMEGALQDTLGIARRELRHSGLQGDDLRMALRELAFRSADVGAGTNLQISQVRQDARGQIQDLLASQGQTERSVLGELQGARQERRQELADEQRQRVQGIQDAVTLEQALKNLGLGSYADDAGGGGMTPTQRREAKSQAENARFYAKSIFDAARADPEGPGDDPREWDEDVWEGLTGAVHSREGIDDVAAARKAVQAIRDHFGGSETGSANALDVLGVVGKAALPIGLSLLSERLGGAPRRRRR